jgi:hypothetical protein
MGLVDGLSAEARAPLVRAGGAPGFAAALAQTAVAREPLANVSAGVGAGSIASIVGAPTDEAVRRALQGNPGVIHDFDVGGSSDMLALGILSAASARRVPGQPWTDSLRLEGLFDMTSLEGNAQNLLIGFLDPSAGANGFDQLRLTLDIFTAGDSTYSLRRNFETVDDALAFFGDNTIDLGLWLPAVGSRSDLNFQLSMFVTMSQPDSGFAIDFVLGNSTIGSGPSVVSEPPVILLCIAALLGLLLTSSTVNSRRR